MNAMAESGVTTHRLTVDDYYRMAEEGLLAPAARVELIDGEILDLPPVSSPHGETTAWLHRQFITDVADRAIVVSQSNMILGRYSAPQPDVMLLRPRADFYRRAIPAVSDLLLVVEVSDSTLPYDRKIKAPLYARHGVPEMWIVNLRHRELICMRQPRLNDYAEIETIKAPGLIPIAALGEIRIDLAGLFDDSDQPAS